MTNATSYDMRHKKQADATWTETTGVTSPRSLTGLDAGTAYEVQLRSMATGYATGAWSASTDFTTLNAGLAAPTPSVGSITQTGASVSWTGVTNATSYDMRHKKQADATWTETTGVTSPRSLTGLDAGTAYEVQLRSMATGYATGAWSASTDFTTLNAGLAAPTPSVGSITQTGASVSWTGVTNATSYDMRHKKQADATWTETTGVTSPRSLTGLDAGTAYEVQLRSMATGYATGAWSASTDFTTLNAGLAAPTPSVGSITQTGASVSWTGVTNATSYDMRHKKQADATWTETTGVTSPRSLTGLDAGTAYEVQLRSMATGYATGAWSSSTDFTTLQANTPYGPWTVITDSTKVNAVSSAVNFNNFAVSSGIYTTSSSNRPTGSTHDGGYAMYGSGSGRVQMAGFGSSGRAVRTRVSDDSAWNAWNTNPGATYTTTNANTAAAGTSYIVQLGGADILGSAVNSGGTLHPGNFNGSNI